MTTSGATLPRAAAVAVPVLVVAGRGREKWLAPAGNAAPGRLAKGYLLPLSSGELPLRERVMSAPGCCCPWVMLSISAGALQLPGSPSPQACLLPALRAASPQFFYLPGSLCLCRKFLLRISLFTIWPNEFYQCKWPPGFFCFFLPILPAKPNDKQ